MQRIIENLYKLVEFFEEMKKIITRYIVFY